MLQEFYINELIETIETDEIYAIMNKRILYCKDDFQLPSEPYGPNDICYLVKESYSKSFLGIGGKKTTKIGAYHFIFGLDTSNVAYISAYISKFIQKLNVPNNMKITQSIFCTFDYFFEKDLRILIKIPGGVKKVFFIDDQSALEANANDMRTVYLSSLIRSWGYKDQGSVNNCLFMEEVNNIDSFNYMIESVQHLLKGKKYILIFIIENAEYKYPNLRFKIRIFFDFLVKFLMNTRRFDVAVVNFSSCN
jgi:hypothetical protein